MGGACSAGQVFSTPFGVTMKTSKENKSTVPYGAQSCLCPPKKAAGKSREVLEFVETEAKGVVEYNFARKKSGWTAGIAKFVRIWFHCNYADIPKSLRKLKPPREAEQWVWAEVWHMSKWIVYTDPYTHQRYRFRMWTRSQIAPGDWTEEDNKPPEEEEKKPEEEQEETETDENEKTDETTKPNDEEVPAEPEKPKFASIPAPPSIAMPPTSITMRSSIGSIPSPPISPLAPLATLAQGRMSQRTPMAPSSPPPMDILPPQLGRVPVPPSIVNSIAKDGSVTRDPDSPTA